MPLTPPNSQRNLPTPLLSLSLSLSLSPQTQTQTQTQAQDIVLKSSMGNGNGMETEYDVKGYALSGKIMLVSIVILFIVIIIMLCIHVYARWYLHRAPSLRRHRPVRRRRSHFVFYVDPAMRTAEAAAASRGLDAAVIASLPVFTFSPKTHPDPVDCPVCLSEFGDGETGRILPKCNHTFHTECIDMWFHSHSTCPLCRAPVEPPTRPEFVVTVCEPEPGSSSGLCEECQLGGDELHRTGPAVSSPSSSSNVLVRKPSSLVSMSVEVPGRNDDSGCDSPSSSFRSPVSRMLSLKRILSRERKASVSPSSGCAVGCSSTAEFDTEHGGRVETQ